MRKRLGLLALAAGLGLGAAAWAQSPPPVQVKPGTGTTANGNASSTIVATGVFQQVFAATTQPRFRNGCTIQNNGANPMYVTEGIGIAGSTTGNSAVIAAGGIFYCNVGEIALQGEIDITGTIGEAFYAAQF